MIGQIYLDPLVNKKFLQCSCEKLCDADSSLILALREQITIQDHSYVLKGLVRHQGRHFTCAVENVRNEWDYLDDLRDNVIHYSCLNGLYSSNQCGWFFCLYVLENNDLLNLENLDYREEPRLSLQC